MRRAMLILLLLAAPLIMAAQDDTPVALCTEWVATVDDSQHIVLRWSPSPDPRATGYIISTGDTLRTYATVNGRTDTTLRQLERLHWHAIRHRALQPYGAYRALRR